MSCARLPVVVVLDNVRSLYNTGAFFRTADGCAVERLVLCGITPRPDQGGRQQRAIAKTALGAELSVPWEYQPDTRTALAALAADGYHIVAVETARQSVGLYEWTPSWPLCLVFGHEKEGVGPDVAGVVETSVRIPMLGEKRSLNVATAAGVVLYELLRRRMLENARQPAVASAPVAELDGRLLKTARGVLLQRQPHRRGSFSSSTIFVGAK